MWRFGGRLLMGCDRNKIRRLLMWSLLHVEKLFMRLRKLRNSANCDKILFFFFTSNHIREFSFPSQNARYQTHTNLVDFLNPLWPLYIWKKNLEDEIFFFQQIMSYFVNQSPLQTNFFVASQEKISLTRMKFFFKKEPTFQIIGIRVIASLSCIVL